MTNQATLPQPGPAPAPPARRAPPPAFAGVPGSAAGAPTGSRTSLKDAKRGIIRNEPWSILAHGTEGVGKSTLAANAPRCLVLDIGEKGTGDIPVFGRLRPTSWDDLLGILSELAREQHEYRSVALDSLDWLEPMCWKHVCDKAGKPNLKAFGYGDGYTAALDEWRVLRARLEDLQVQKGMNVVLIAHSHCNTFKNPDAAQGDYDRYQLKLQKQAAALWKEWAKAVLFLQYDRSVVEVDGRNKGIDNGKRVIFTRMSAAYDAKNRLWLPEKLPLSWSSLEKAIMAGADLRGKWDDALWKLSDEARTEAQAWIESVDFDPGKVAKMIDEMRAATQAK